MMNKRIRYVYIDESGDPGEKGSKFMVFAALITEEFTSLDRIIKNMRRNSFKKELCKSNEIKANKSSSELRKHMLGRLNDIKNARVLFIVLDKEKLYSEYLRGDKHKLYNFVAGKLARQIRIDCYETEVRIDKSKGKQVLQDDFNSYFTRLVKETSSISKLNVYHSCSHNWSGLQFADLLAWSCFQKFEHDDSTYTDIIRLDQETSQVWK